MSGRETTIGEAFKLRSGKFLSAKNIIEGKFPVYGGNGINGFHHEYLFKEEKIVIGRVGAHCGNVHISEPFSWITDNAFFIYKKYYDYNDRYLLHLLRNLKLNQYSSQSGQPLISEGRLKDIKIPLPPLEEQKKIAAILDAADILRQKDKALIAKYEELTQSLFLNMFGDPVTNPKGWEKSEVINNCSCIVPGRDKPKSFTGNTAWVTTEDLIHLGYTEKSKKEIGLSLEEIAKVKAKVIPKGSVIITCVGDLGVISINKSDVVVNQQLHTFQCTERLNNVFLMFSLSYQKPYMYKMASSTTVPYMNKTVCNNIPTILPPITLQNQFAERVQQIDKQKQLAQQSLQKSEELFNSLIHRAFKGELTKTLEPA